VEATLDVLCIHVYADDLVIDLIDCAWFNVSTNTV